MSIEGRRHLDETLLSGHVPTGADGDESIRTMRGSLETVSVLVGKLADLLADHVSEPESGDLENAYKLLHAIDAEALDGIIEECVLLVDVRQRAALGVAKTQPEDTVLWEMRTTVDRFELTYCKLNDMWQLDRLSVFSGALLGRYVGKLLRELLRQCWLPGHDDTTLEGAALQHILDRAAQA